VLRNTKAAFEIARDFVVFTLRKVIRDGKICESLHFGSDFAVYPIGTNEYITLVNGPVLCVDCHAITRLFDSLDALL
jgi:hypothetical protein